MPASLWTIACVSFLMALSGALMPGPLFTYTIARTLQTRTRGYLVGAEVIVGHAALETVILAGLALGIAEFLKTPAVITIIGALGALLLGYMGVGLVLEAVRGRAGDPQAFRAESVDSPKSAVGRLSPVLAGAIISMSNPYWWVWWITAGSATLMSFGVSLASWPGLLAFFLGHEAADLGWYFTVSTLTHFGRRKITGGFYRVVLAVCGIFIAGFGAYLGLSAWLKGA
jgi:threonine/homoserine/homoserine lactone efflux protein